MTRRISQGMVYSWLRACSWDIARFQIPVKTLILILLPGTKVKFEVTAPTRGTWKNCKLRLKKEKLPLNLHFFFSLNLFFSISPLTVNRFFLIQYILTIVSPASTFLSSSSSSPLLQIYSLFVSH